MTFDATRSYLADVDVRDLEDWPERLQQQLPNGALWPLIGPRRWGKTWALRRLESKLARGWAHFLDLRDTKKQEIFRASRDGGCLLLDEPGYLIRKDASSFLDVCAQHHERGTRVLVAMTPCEWAFLTEADPAQVRVQTRDRRMLPPLNATEAKKLARTEWARNLFSCLPGQWTRSPFLLELTFEVAETNPDLRTDLARLFRTVFDHARSDRLNYVHYLFEEGLSQEQQQALRTVSQRRNTTKIYSVIAFLRECGLVDGPHEQPALADPILADHLPPPLIIHHISDIHIGAKSAGVVDQKEKGLLGERLGTAVGDKYVRDSYRAHVAALRETERAPHILVVSGDVAETGNPDEFQTARTWLETVRASLSSHPDLQMDSPKVLLVGGNHDVDWSKADTANGARERHFAFRDAFCDIPRPLLEDAPETRMLTTVAYPDCGVEFLLLGSAEMGGETATDPEYKELLALVGRMNVAALDALAADDVTRYERLRNYVNRIDPGIVHDADLKKIERHKWSQPVRIAVLHHPVSPLPSAPEVARFAGLLNAGSLKDTLFKAGVALVLHGHQHSGWCALECWPSNHGDRKLLIAAAPTLGSRETQENLGFNEISLFREGDTKYGVELQRYVRRGTDWVPVGSPLTVYLPSGI